MVIASLLFLVISGFIYWSVHIMIFSLPLSVWFYLLVYPFEMIIFVWNNFIPSIVFSRDKLHTELWMCLIGWRITLKEVCTSRLTQLESGSVKPAAKRCGQSLIAIAFKITDDHLWLYSQTVFAIIVPSSPTNIWPYCDHQFSRKRLFAI